MKFVIPVLFSTVSLILGVEYVLSIRRVSGKVDRLNENVRKMAAEMAENDRKDD